MRITRRKMKIDISFPHLSFAFFSLNSSYLHVFVEFLRAIKGDDVDALEILNNFTVGMIQRRAHHVAADGYFYLALGILNQNRAVERDQHAV